MSRNADLILKNGIIETMCDGARATAVAACDGRIIYVGDDAGTTAFAGEQTEVIDLKGRYVSPGFIDGHTHEVSYLLEEKDRSKAFFFESVPSDPESYREAFAEFVAEHPEEGVYRGYGMDLNTFTEGTPDNRWLNEICPDKPICILDLSEHCFLMNAKALEQVGLDRDTPEPRGARFYKNPDGELTGFAAEADLYSDKLMYREYSTEEFHDAFAEFQSTCHSYGITAIGIAGPTIPAQKAWKVFHEMEQAGELALRVNCAIIDFDEPGLSRERGRAYADALDEGQKYNSDFQRVSQAKALIDGVLEGKSAFLLEPYAPEAGEKEDYKGLSYADRQELCAFTDEINKAGYQLQFHAIGDGAVRLALDAFEHSQAVNGTGDYRNIIAHISLISEEDVKRMADLKVIGAMQPIWWYRDPNFAEIEERVLGSQRFDREYRVREMMDAGIVITGSADYPVTPDYRPLAGIQVGATQGSPYTGQCEDRAYVRRPEQAVSAWEMLKCYTINGAIEMKMEDLIGTIETGKKADLVVLGQDILNCDKRAISETEVCMTIMDGRIVYMNNLNH